MTGKIHASHKETEKTLFLVTILKKNGKQQCENNFRYEATYVLITPHIYM